MEGNDDLNSSVEDLIDPIKNRLDPNYNADEANNNIDPLDTLQKPNSNLVPDTEGNKDVTDLTSILNSITVPDHPDCPSAMFRVTEPSQVPQADSPINVSTAGCAEDPSMSSMTPRSRVSDSLVPWTFSRE